MFYDFVEFFQREGKRLAEVNRELLFDKDGIEKRPRVEDNITDKQPINKWLHKREANVPVMFPVEISKTSPEMMS